MAMLFRSIAGFGMAPTRMAVFRGYANKFALRSSQTLSNVNLNSNLKAFSIYNLSENELKSLLLEWKQPSFRAKQIFSWLYEKGARDFDAMLDLPLPLREKLKASFQFGTLKLISEQVSKDGTRKRAYELLDGQIIESVLMPYKDGRRTACISSQAGCGMGCVFCATGQMGFSRQLTSGEIFEQAQLFSSELKAKGERLSNIVMMGMGEPLANYDNVLTAIRRFNDELGIGARHITISTVGIAPRIRKLAEENLQVGLAISLHQATDEKRSALMPVNKRFNIETLIDACRYYIEKTNRRISFEWALISGQTDTDDTAHELGVLLRGLLCHVNVIPLNPTKGFDGQPTTKDGVERFIKILSQYGVPATPRTRRGIDIDAGCGQLKSELLRKRREAKSTE
jgi:23S rRNA (adenine2503-C2)-methyltransferase